MSKLKSFLKNIRDFVFGTINSVKAADLSIDEQIIFEKDIFFMPEFKNASNCSNINFASYEVTTPAFYVRSFNNALCFTNSEEVFSTNKEIINEYTSQKKNPKIGESKLIFYKSKKKKINAVVAHLSLSGLENNYYHFLTECLARLYLLEKSRFKPNFYIISNQLSFQREILDLLGITADRIIPTDRNLFLQVKTLVVPDFTNNWNLVYYRGFKGYEKRWQPKWSKNLYLEKINLLKHNKNIKNKKVFISREKAAYRKFTNQTDVDLLFFQLGFEKYYLEEMTVFQQIELFSSVDFVAGIHGAGFANLYFSNQQTKIFEIYSEYYHDSSFRVLSNCLGLSHTCFIGQTADFENIPPKKEDIYVDIYKLKKALIEFVSQ